MKILIEQYREWFGRHAKVPTYGSVCASVASDGEESGVQLKNKQIFIKRRIRCSSRKKN
jgi:hypothetical protein